MEICIGRYNVLIDDFDKESVEKIKWYVATIKKDGLVYFSHPRKIKIDGRYVSKELRLHRYIMGCKSCDGMIIDHINGNTLDNRRENLRVCNHSDSQKNRKIQSNNRSGHKGVTWSKKQNKWIAQIQDNHKKIHLGSFDDLEEAALAYKEKAKELFGEFVRS